MEKHRLKIRITRPDRTKARLAFELDHAGSFSAHSKSSGFEGLGGTGNYFKISIQDYEIWLETPSGRQKAEVGLTFSAGEGSIEFLEVPEIPRPPVEESTRMVSLDAATQMMQVELKTKSTTQIKIAAAAPQKPTFELEMAAKPRSPLPSAKPNVVGSSSAGESTRTSITASRPHPLAKVFEYPGVTTTLSWIGSIAAIAGLCELSARLILMMNPLIPVSQPGTGAICGLIASFAVSTGIWLANGRAGFPYLSILESLNTLAIGALLVPVWALSFAFPGIVGLLAALIVAAVWTFLFQIRHGIPQFGQLSSLSLVICVSLMGAGYQLRASVPPQAPIQVATAEVERTPASASGTPVEATAPASPEFSAMMRKLRGVASANIDEIANTQFFAAIARGDIVEVKQLVRMGKIDPILALDGGSTALHRAAAAGHVEVVKYLLSRKIAIDARDSAGSTALTWAVFRKHREVAQLLLKKGADATIRNDAGDMAFDVASRLDDVEMLKILRDAAARAPANKR